MSSNVTDSKADSTKNVTDKGKGKGKAIPADDSMEVEENEDGDEEEEDEDEDEDEEEEEEDNFEEIDPSAILATGRRTRGVKVDYTSKEAIAKAGLQGKPEDDEEGDDDHVMKE